MPRLRLCRRLRVAIIVRPGQLQLGQHILIHGGSGGVGHFAVQFAKWKGATSSRRRQRTTRNCCVSLVPMKPIDYTIQKFENVVRKIDIVLDTIGGEYAGTLVAGAEARRRSDFVSPTAIVKKSEPIRGARHYVHRSA